jgi:hypothetical protein
MHRLERRVEELDRRVDRRLRAREVTVGTRAPENKTGGRGLRLLEGDG